MKKITLWLFALLTSWQTSAQISNYTFTEGVGAYAALSGTNITATGDDGIQNTLPIGFTFNYAGVDFTTFSVTTNGWIRLGGDIPTSAWINNATNFNGTTFRPMIAPIWDDNHRNTGTISYSVSGVSPNQIFTVDYNAVNIGGNGATNATNLANYQIKLYETTNVIEFHYGAMATAGTLTATVGLSDVSGFQSVTPGNPGTSSPVTANHAIASVANIANKMYRFTPPACASPGGLNASSVTSSTVTIGWNAVIPAPTGYEYVVSTTNAIPVGSGTPTTNLSEAITSLASQTVYYVFVRSNCGGTFSSWSSFSFTTACAPITVLPHLETFTTFLPNQCWSNRTGGDLTTGPTPTNVFASGWVADGLANVGITGAIRNEIWTTGANDWIISPQFTIPATGYELKFDAAAVQFAGTGVPSTPWESDDIIEVLVSSNGTTNWTVLHTYNDTNQPGITATPLALNLDAYYSGQTVRFAFRAVEGATNGAADIDFSIDNFQVRLTPTCPDQTGLVVGGITATDANTSWDDLTGSGAVGYEYAITTSATPPASGTATTALFYIASGLTPQTVYYLHVRSSCAGATFGNWATITFITACAPITTLPHLEPFNTFLPNQCWSNRTGGDLTTGPTPTNVFASGWVADGLANNGNTGAIRNEIWTTGANDWVISPQFTIPTAGYELKFDAAAVQFAGTGIPTTPWESDDIIEVLVSSTGTTNWTVLHTYNDTNQPGITATPLALNLDAYSGQTVRFAFRAVEGATNGTADIDFSIDNFQVRLTPTCPDQTGLVVGSITTSGANTSWDDLSGSGAVGYEYAITTSATPPASGTSTNSSFYIATGLPQSTMHYLHVRVVCAGSTYGNWATMSFTTLTPPPANDNCANAIVLTPGATFTTNPLVATNVGATGSTETAPGCASYSGGDVWYSVAIPPSGNLTIETATNAGTIITDTGLAVYSGLCGSLVLVLCDDDAGTANFSLISLTGRTPGELLYVRAWVYGNSVFDTFQVSAYDASLSSTSFDKTAFTAFPNPVKDVLNLSYKSEISNVKVLNLLGQEVLNAKPNSNDVKLNLSAFSKGTYFVNIMAEDTVHTIKVIKE